MTSDLSQYIQTHYGTCAMSEQENKCECLYKQRDQRACEHYTPTTATTWEELLAQAKERYSKRKNV